MFWASTDDDGCRFGHHCCWRTSPNSIKHKVDKNILISTLIYWFYQNPSTAALEVTCERPPTTWMVWIHWIHAAGGASSSITMVVVFVGCLCCCGWTRDITSSSYVKNGAKITLRWGLTALHFDPLRRAPHLLVATSDLKFFHGVPAM